MKTKFNIKKLGFIMALLAIVSMYSCQENFEEFDSLDEIEATMFEGGQIIPNQYIVVLNNGGLNFNSSNSSYTVQREDMRLSVLNLLSKYKISEDQLNSLYVSAIKGFSARLSDDQYTALRNDPLVSYIEQDKVASIAQNGKRPGGGGSSTSGQETPYGITRVGGAVNYSGNNVAWVIDTGIDLTHPDLNVNANRGFTAFKSGRDANLNDNNGHGTHVAGTIAAINNTVGVVGVAAGAQVIPIKVLGSNGSGTNSGVIEGVDFVSANGVAGDVANMSLGGGISTALDNAVINAAAKGIKFVLAAGNSSTDANSTSPARANGANIYTISAMDRNDVWASFSNFGNPPVDFCAPGVSIRSTWMKGGYNTISGTSMAAPHAAGVLLLGSPKTSGNVKNDPDGNADPIISRN